MDRIPSHNPKSWRNASEALKLAVILGLTSTLLGLMLVRIHQIRRQPLIPFAPSEPELGNTIVVAELELGKYRKQSGRVDRQEVAVSEFTAFAEVQGTLPKVGEIEWKLRAQQHSVRESIHVILRQAAPHDFADPACTALRERIRAAVNEVIGSEAIDDILLTTVRNYTVPCHRPAVTQDAVNEPPLQYARQSMHPARL